MNRLENIYNQNYGKCVVTNGNFVAIGNPPNHHMTRVKGYQGLVKFFSSKKIILIQIIN